jgi:hypothetical protein
LSSRAPCSAPDRQPHEDSRVALGRERYVTPEKKRPALIPVLDNQAIFGAYMYPLWPSKPSLMEAVKAAPRIKEALDWIFADLTRPENEGVWPQLQSVESGRSLIELFDMVWWTYFRRVEPVPGSTTA